MENYKITHIGNGEFNVTLSTGEIKSAGSSLKGMIRYTYFEDFTLPEIGWSCERIKLLNDHTNKILNDSNMLNYVK